MGRILVVDDNAPLARQVVRLLRSRYGDGFAEIEAHGSIEHALATAAEDGLDLRLIVLDLCFGADADAGLGFLEQVDRGLWPRVVVFTAYDFPAVRRRLAQDFEIGAARVVSKSEGREALLAACASALGLDAGRGED